MVVSNRTSRFYLAAVVLRFSDLRAERVQTLTSEFTARMGDAVRSSREHFEDPADVRDWTLERVLVTGTPSLS